MLPGKGERNVKPQVSWTGLWQGWLGFGNAVELRRAQAEEQRLRQEVEAAHREMEVAERYFHAVTEPELVDHAIFAMEAARRKYLYLYRQLRRSQGGLPDRGAEDSEWS